MQILIIGKSAKECVLAKKIKEQNPEDIIFIAPGNQAVGDYATCIDIQCDNVDELVDFAMANEINLTIVSDYIAIENEVVDAFNAAGLMVFGPAKESARFAINKSVGKRFMYKLSFPTPKFGIFDKENVARDYLKNSAYPVLVKLDRHEAGERNYLCHSEREANIILNKLFTIDMPKVVIENYVSGREFSLYALTDGYNAIPICAVEPFKYASEKDGGCITAGVGACTPAVFVDEEITYKVLNEIIYPALAEVEKSSAPYVGVIGVDVILDNENNINVIEFNTFFNEPDIETIFELLEEDIVVLFKACAVGSLADDYDYIRMSDGSSVSVVLTKVAEHIFDDEEKEIIGIDDLDEEIKVSLYNAKNKNGKTSAKTGRILSLTNKASTLKQAKINLSEWIDCVKFKGMKFRKDILENINER